MGYQKTQKAFQGNQKNQKFNKDIEITKQNQTNYGTKEYNG